MEETKQPATRDTQPFDVELASLDTQPPPAAVTPANGTIPAVEDTAVVDLEIKSDVLMLDLSKYILLLATLVATVTYAAAFYYCNATAFASSLVVIVIVLFLHERTGRHTVGVQRLQAVMVVDLLSLVGAYAAATCRDRVTTVYSLVLVGAAVAYLAVQMAWASFRPNPYYYRDVREAAAKKRLRKVLMLLATFAVSVTYVAGMSTPGGFWDAGSGHSPGHAILKEGHGKRLTVFLCFNAAAFVASLLIVVVLLDRKPRANQAYGLITIALISLAVAYIAGSCRETDTTIYVSSLVGAVLTFIIFLQVAVAQGWIEGLKTIFFWNKIEAFYDCVSGRLRNEQTGPQPPGSNNGRRETVDKASSLVLLLATLAATITYQAGLNPPGGVWPANGDSHMAGDPILLTTNARRFKAFFYCNSVAFVASLVAIILVQNKLLLETHVLEAAMILDLFGLIGAYAAGSCRDVSTSIYAMALAGAVLVYVVIHIVFFTLHHTDITRQEIELVEKRRKRLLLFAVLAATITYQAGLTPPGGFRLQDDVAGGGGHYAGDPVLLYNFPHRYTAFFYCNSVSFMLSIALIVLLVNPHLYRPAIRSYALAVCTAAGMLSLMGSYAAGSTQHLRTSIYIFVLVAVVISVIAGLVMYTGSTDSQPKPENHDEEGKKRHAKRKYLMLLGILVASVTYQAGLSPPGGTWQSDGGGYSAGNPIMHDNRRPRYLAFFYSNSASFMASIVVIVLLLPQWRSDKQWSLKVMNITIFLDLLALLGAYAAGSSRGWKTSMYVLALIGAVLAFVAIHIWLASSRPQHESPSDQADPTQSHEGTNGENGEQLAAV